VFLHHVLQACFNVLEECAASIFRVTELVNVDAEVIGKKACVNYIGKLRELWSMRATERGKGISLALKQWGLKFQEWP
jgi:hypothetical protein